VETNTGQPCVLIHGLAIGIKLSASLISINNKFTVFDVTSPS